ncbi:MAG: FtsX-like permease family protein [Peptococcaceae bacterium]|nr:FtsX-like permease family protein [Peptococcaceae bacterium]
MNIIKRAMTSIIRKPGKTVILLILVFVLGNVIAGTISIRQAIHNTETHLRSQFSPVAFIGIDEAKLERIYRQNPEFIPDEIPVEVFEKMGALPYVKYYDYSINASLESKSIQRYTTTTILEGWNFFDFRGVNNPEMIDLKEDKIRLVSGRVFREQELMDLTYVVLISQNLAQKNNLAVGSKIELENNIYNYQVFDDEDESFGDTIDIIRSQKYEVEIIGIFEPTRQVRDYYETIPDQIMDETWDNRIYIPNKVLHEAHTYTRDEIISLNPEKAEIASYTGYYNIFVLNDPNDLKKFREEVAGHVPDYVKAIDIGESYDKVAAPLNSMKDVATIILLAAACATIIILSLLIILFLKDRRQELGIYLSLGEKKAKIAGQIVLEVAVVAVVAITLSLFSGNIISGTLSEKMLADQVIAEQERVAEYGGNSGYSGYSSSGWSALEQIGYSLDINSEDLVNTYAVSLDFLTAFLFYAIGLGTVCVSTLIPILYTTRLNPKKILM